MQKVKITKVYRGTVDTKYGEKEKVGIKTEQHGEKWLSCFVNERNKRDLDGLAEGQETEIIVTPSGDFLNFRLPTGFDKLEQRVEKLEAATFGNDTAEPVEPPTQDASQPEPGPDDIPF